MAVSVRTDKRATECGKISAPALRGSSEDSFLIIDCLNIETERTETVVATNHCTHRILHPTIVEIALSLGQRLNELLLS